LTLVAPCVHRLASTWRDKIGTNEGTPGLGHPLPAVWLPGTMSGRLGT